MRSFIKAYVARNMRPKIPRVPSRRALQARRMIISASIVGASIVGVKMVSDHLDTYIQQGYVQRTAQEGVYGAQRASLLRRADTIDNQDQGALRAGYAGQIVTDTVLHASVQEHLLDSAVLDSLIDLESRIATLQGAIGDRDAMIASLGSTMRAYGSTLAALPSIAEVNELEARLTRAEAMRRDDRASIDERDTLIASFQGIIASYEHDRATLTDRIATLEEMRTYPVYGERVQDGRSLRHDLADVSGEGGSLSNDDLVDTASLQRSAQEEYERSFLAIADRIPQNRSFFVRLDHYDAHIISDGGQVYLDILEQGCRRGCDSLARIVSSHALPYSLEWGSFNHPDGGYVLGADAFSRVLDAF